MRLGDAVRDRGAAKPLLHYGLVIRRAALTSEVSRQIRLDDSYPSKKDLL